MRALARSHRRPASENKTCRLFEAARESILGGRRLLSTGVESRHPAPRKFAVPWQIQLQCLNDGTCGRAHTDSCAGVTPYCSLWVVGYDILCGGFDPLSRSVRRKRPGALSAPGEG